MVLSGNPRRRKRDSFDHDCSWPALTLRTTGAKALLTASSPRSTGPDSCGNGCAAIRPTKTGIGIEAKRLGAGCAPPTVGGCSFAEDPARAAPDATIIWSAAFDPGTLRVKAVPAADHDPDALRPQSLRAWLQTTRDEAGEEHVAFSNGWRRIRLDLVEGTLSDGPVVLSYDLSGLASLKPKLVSLQRLIALVQHQRFPARLYPADGHVRRWVDALHVSDALRSGASYREIGVALLGEAAVARGWDETTDSARSRVRRLVREARGLAAGGFWKIMGGR